MECSSVYLAVVKRTSSPRRNVFVVLCRKCRGSWRQTRRRRERRFDVTRPGLSEERERAAIHTLLPLPPREEDGGYPRRRNRGSVPGDASETVVGEGGRLGPTVPGGGVSVVVCTSFCFQRGTRNLFFFLIPRSALHRRSSGWKESSASRQMPWNHSTNEIMLEERRDGGRRCLVIDIGRFVDPKPPYLSPTNSFPQIHPEYVSLSRYQRLKRPSPLR